MIKVLLISGEPSGDFLGASLIKAIKTSEVYSDTEISFQGIGGPLMESEGFVSLIEQNRINKMGIVEILLNLYDLLGALKKISNYCEAWKPNLIVTIDSPEFSFRLNKRVRKYFPNMPIIHYVMPTIWAWRPNRLKKIRRCVDHILALYPFEPNLAKMNGLSCDFVGHPVISIRIPASQDIAVLRRLLEVGMDVPLMAVLPGSRVSEIKNNLPIYLETIKKVAAVYTDLVFVIPAILGLEDLIQRQVDSFKQKTGLRVIVFKQSNLQSSSNYEQMKFSLFRTAAIALATSGTVVLELARMGVPMVIGYRSYLLNEFIIKRMVRTKRANLIDIISNTATIPEFLFRNCNPTNLSNSIIEILSDANSAAEQLELSRKVIRNLGFGSDHPGDRAAASIINFLKQQKLASPFIQ